MAGPQAAQHRTDAGEEVGHAGQVGEDEVAVEADDRDELLQHLDLQGERGQQEQAAAAWRRSRAPSASTVRALK